MDTADALGMHEDDVARAAAAAKAFEQRRAKIIEDERQQAQAQVESTEKELTDEDYRRFLLLFRCMLSCTHLRRLT